MRVLGADLPRSGDAAAEATIVQLGADGRIARVEHLASLPEVAAAVGHLAGDEPFLLGINTPVVIPGKLVRSRPLESLVRRRFGFKLPPGGRSALAAEPAGIASEALMAGLAAAGHPVIPYPDRDRRRPGVAEVWPALVLKALLWSRGHLGGGADEEQRRALFQGYAPPTYRAAQLPARTPWMERLARLDQTLRAMGSPEGFDLDVARDAVDQAGDERDTERAAGVLDAALLAGMALRYLDHPAQCLFVGDQETGYLLLPADEFIRGLTSEARPTHGRLFPKGSLRDRLGEDVKLRQVDLLAIPGRPQRLEAAFAEPPSYEFDNLDEMLWWKHTRHVKGPSLPTEGLHEMTVKLGENGDDEDQPLRLVRSRHRTLSYRFEPPTSWRSLLSTRDGQTYHFQVLRAVYETLPAD